jgi:hypothetical protein
MYVHIFFFRLKKSRLARMYMVNISEITQESNSWDVVVPSKKYKNMDMNFTFSNLKKY